MLRLSLSTGTFYHLPLRNTFAMAREAGFEGVELVLGPEIVLRGAAHVRRLSQEYRLPIFSVHPPVIPYPGMNRAAAILPRLVSLAEQVECDLVVLHTPKVTTQEEASWNEFVEALQRQNERSNPGVRVSLENGGFFRESDARYMLYDMHRLRAFADRYDMPLTFDTAHAGTSGYDLLQAYALLASRVVNIHFSDLMPRRFFPDLRPLHTFLKHHQMPGQGVLPLTDLVRMLRATNYQGIFTLELSPTAIHAWNLSRAREALANAVQFVRRLESNPLPAA